MRLVRVTEVLSKWNPYHNEEAMERGRIVHDLAAMIARGKVAFPVEAVTGYQQSILSWMQHYVQEIVLVEERFGDPLLGFTGQVDLIFRFKGSKGLTLGDYKTGTRVKTWPLQLAAYAYLARKNGYDIKRSGNIVLYESGKPGKWVPPDIPEQEAYRHFMEALSLYRYFYPEGEKDE